MFDALRRLSLGFTLILVAAATLLLTDLGSRKNANTMSGVTKQKTLRIALVQHSSIKAHDDGASGTIEALAQRGYAEGACVHIKRFNAQADPGTASAIAKQVTTGEYDIIITIGTPSLQYVANANREGSRTRHVFGLVTDPYSSGTGIDALDHSKHPPYMTGSGCMQPVADAFETAKKMFPALRSVGLIWNPSESNSQAQTLIARQVCASLGIELVESTVDNSTSALEAASALTSRGVHAIWISGDITVALAADAIITIARRANIPVFSSFPPLVKSGSLFDLGANYFEIGKTTGGIAADVLDGKSPADIPVENIAPKIFLLNEKALTGLRDPWQIAATLRAEAATWGAASETKIPEEHPLPTKP